MENEDIGKGSVSGETDASSQAETRATDGSGEGKINSKIDIRATDGSGSQIKAETPEHLTVVELAPLAIGRSGKPVRRITLTGDLPEAIAEQIRPGMTWDGEEWFTADGQPVEMRELSTA